MNSTAQYIVLNAKVVLFMSRKWFGTCGCISYSIDNAFCCLFIMYIYIYIFILVGPGRVLGSICVQIH